MTENESYLKLNREAWDRCVPKHAASEFYDLEGFKSGKEILNAVELGLLGNIRDKSLLHLQCHFGMDTLALARHGAVVTGVDFSPVAIEQAAALSRELNIPGTFVCSDIYSLPEVSHDTFDIVFTSYGTIGWLPDCGKWAKVIANQLNQNGKFVMADFHPVVWMYDSDFEKVEYSYFNKQEIVETKPGSYADTNSQETYTTVGWNHSLGDILGSLIAAGLRITHFAEHDYSPYACFKHLEQGPDGGYRIKHLNGMIPMMYSIVAEKGS